MPGKKNKRGERGSTKEDSRTSKKSNMAAEVATDMEGMVHADQEEPTLFEIKEMLIVYKFQLRLSLKKIKR